MRVLSLGAGVQSSTLALMIEAGQVASVDLAVFADTGWEPRAVYDYLEWLTATVSFRVVVDSAGNLRKAMKTVAIPFYVKGADGQVGMRPRRACTRDYKVAVVNRQIRQAHGVKQLGARSRTSLLLGISTDEAVRMRPNKSRWVTNEYPLIEAGMSRADCLAWMARAGYPPPPRSACLGCPFRSDPSWAQLKRESPAEWAATVEADRELHTLGLCMHRSGKVLDQVDLGEDAPDLPWGDECEGMCGL